ncbi:MAG: translation initiation factor IF-2 N-terminal domain-containing protein [Labilithrix sp.]|nr:translation initiation factor IF-2 N-terminal domain-containing protein [Labilithrix sp.]MBX3219161.1 translation initiation factor IF-2 N-terminal domain-containing protein [Labilithrix sp.]
MSSPTDDEREDEDVEERDDVDAYAAPCPPAPVKARPPVRLEPNVTVRAIAEQLGVPPAQVAAELVGRGFFEVTPASTLTRDAARIVVEAFGRSVVEVPVSRKAARPPTRRSSTARRAAPSKRAAKTSSSPTKRSPKVSKTKKKRVSRGRAGWRAA